MLGISDLVKSLQDAVKAIYVFQQGLALAQQQLTTSLTNVTNAVTSAQTGISSALATAQTGISNSLTSAETALATAVTNAATGIDTALNNASSGLDTAVNAVQASIANEGGAIVTAITTSGSGGGGGTGGLTLAQEQARTFYSITDFGAVGDGTTDNLTAFQNAVNFIVGLGPGFGGATLFIPAGTFRITSEINLNHIPQDSTGRVMGIQGTGFASQILFDPSSAGLTAGGGNPTNGFFSAAIVFGNGINDLQTAPACIKDLSLVFKAGNVQPRWCGIINTGGGKHFRVENVLIHGFPLDGFRAEPSYNNGWIESLELHHVQSQNNGQDNFSFILNNYSNVFITETLMYKCSSRAAGRNAIRIIQNNTSGSNYKISNLFVQHSEIDCQAGSDPNCVTIEQNSSVGGNIIENIAFVDCTLEDIFNSHSGYAIGFAGSGTQPISGISVDRCIYYGEASGGAPVGTSKPANVTYDRLNFNVNGDRRVDGMYRRLATLDISTGNIGTGTTATVVPAAYMQATGLYRVNVCATDGSANQGEWLIYLGNVTNVVTVFATGCSLSISGGNAILTNNAGFLVGWNGAMTTLR